MPNIRHIATVSRMITVRRLRRSGTRVGVAAPNSFLLPSNQEITECVGALSLIIDALRRDSLLNDSWSADRIRAGERRSRLT